MYVHHKIIRIQYTHHTKNTCTLYSCALNLHTHFIAFAYCNVRAEIVILMQYTLCVITNNEREQCIAHNDTYQCTSMCMHYILCIYYTHSPANAAEQQDSYNQDDGEQCNCYWCHNDDKRPQWQRSGISANYKEIGQKKNINLVINCEITY